MEDEELEFQEKQSDQFLAVTIDEQSHLYCLVKFTDSDFVQIVNASCFLRRNPGHLHNFHAYCKALGNGPNS